MSDKRYGKKYILKGESRNNFSEKTQNTNKMYLIAVSFYEVKISGKPSSYLQ